MKRLNLVMLLSAFLIVGEGANLRAGNDDAIGTCYINLPVIDAELADYLTTIDLVVRVLDSNGKPAVLPDTSIYSEMARWQKGKETGWYNAKKMIVPRLAFRMDKDPKKPNLQIQLMYKAYYKWKGVIKTEEAEEKLQSPVFDPIWAREADVTARFPFELLTIDAGQLQFAPQTELRVVNWTVEQAGTDTKGKNYNKLVGSLPANELLRMLVHREVPVKAAITFGMVRDGHMEKIQWADNARNLRELPAGLKIVLSQPVYPK